MSLATNGNPHIYRGEARKSQALLYVARGGKIPIQAPKGTMKALITRKVGMTSTIAENGSVQAVTLLSTSPCFITQIKNAEIDGYWAVQLGCEEAKHTGKAQSGHFKSANFMPKLVSEIRIPEGMEDIKVGEQINADVFNVGDVVHVTATSKGKGFAGTIRRHNFHRQRKTHGGKGNTRKPGSIGSMYPQRIFKGKKMSGQLGSTQVTVRNLKITLIDPELGVIGVMGAVPGPRKGIVILRGDTLVSERKDTAESTT